MIIGIGNDLEQIDRVKNLAQSQEKFIPSVLTQLEQEQLKTKTGKHYWEYLAGRFSAKEAYSKATGFGIGEHARWMEIEILSNELGAPKMTIKENSKIVANQKTFVAISHSDNYIMTNVVIEEV